MFPDLAVFNKDGTTETVKYHLLPSFLLAGYQSQQQTIAAQAEKIEAQAERIDDAGATAARHRSDAAEGDDDGGGVVASGDACSFTLSPRGRGC